MPATSFLHYLNVPCFSVGFWLNAANGGGALPNDEWPPVENVRVPLADGGALRVDKGNGRYLAKMTKGSSSGALGEVISGLEKEISPKDGSLDHCMQVVPAGSTQRVHPQAVQRRL